jgi:predicted SnoaL-like aldol condensation-catalyzing enzyme
VNEQQKIKIACDFLLRASRGEVSEAFRDYVREDFFHHNQYFPGDRRSLMAAMAEAHDRNPGKQLEIKRSVCEGEIVMTHSRVIQATPDGRDIAVVHIFRFADGKIAELWDVGQVIDQTSPNTRGMF